MSEPLSRPIGRLGAVIREGQDGTKRRSIIRTRGVRVDWTTRGQVVRPMASGDSGGLGNSGDTVARWS